MLTYYRRNLPHWQPPGQDIFITWRLHGSLPPQMAPPKENSSPGEAFVHYDRILDGAHIGPVWLKDPRVAEAAYLVLRDARSQKLFRLRAYVLMANHVHVLLEPHTELANITRHIKGVTARQANLILSRTGEHFWQDESFDHWVRGPAEFEKIRAYIERNPVAAGLVARPEDWLWSSASRLID